MSTQQQVIAFSPYDTPLEPGINLIEASAGTGKTFSIAMLVMRFILQKGYRIDQLLVVTFTNAAAQELRDRIRARLLEVKAVFSGKSTKDDVFNEWVASLPEQSAKNALTDALADIDNAHIFTIHGFCQRMLSQYALESGQIFGSELLQNTAHIKQQIAEDYWRLATYSRSVDQVVLLRNTAISPYGLMASVNDIREGSTVVPDADSLDSCLAVLEESLQIIRPTINERISSIEKAIQDHTDKFKKIYVDELSQIKDKLQLWVTGSNVALPLDEILLISTQGLSNNGLNGTKFRKTKVLTGEQRKRDFINEQGIDASAIDELEPLLDSLRIAFQKGLYVYSEVEMESRLSQSNQLSFDGIIKRLSQALQGETANKGDENSDSAQHLKQLLQHKFPVALIDEFQDTDDAQWTIFSSLASQATSNYLYLIGDPKQAIYKFRGADIYSYLSAKQQAHRYYNLTTNWRSQQPLVDAVNTLFDVDKPFLIEEIAYYPVNAAKQETLFSFANTKRAATEGAAGSSAEKLVLWELDKNPNQKDGYWLASKGKPKDQIRTHVVKEILTLLSQTDTNGEVAKTLQLDGNPVVPSDIAILVRSNPEAATYQQVLMQYGIPAVLNSKTSVFASQQAVEIYHLLQAILRPGNQQLIRYALCQSWFGLNGNDLYDLLDQPQQLDIWLIRFQRYHELWERKGLLAMMQKLIAEQQVVQHLAVYADVERSITNINHVLEMLQEAAISNRLSPLKTVEWLEDAMQERIMQDGQELRLESDKDAVSIVTIHSSKGLEYPIVFCPDLWAKSGGFHSNIVVAHKDGQQISDLGSGEIEQHRALMDEENRAEELRLLYVAITRAKYRCYLAWADQRTIKEENASALAYLYKQQEGEDWRQRIEALQTKNASAFEHIILEVDAEIMQNYHQLGSNKELTIRKLQREVKADWMMSSYSAMAYYSVHDEVPELPLDKAQESYNATVQEVPVIDPLPKGAHTGNLVHELLEHTSFSVLSSIEPGELDSEYLDNREKMIKRFAVDIKSTEVLDQLLSDTVNTVLSADDTDFKLCNLSDHQCLKEMPFYFAIDQLDTLEVNRVLAQSEAYLPLSAQQMHGQLTGFIDLICEYQGKYYVMDYKTNSLDDYSVEKMTESMREHNYGLQYWIYSLVLHRYLTQTLADYSFDKHFGGVRYLFVRGMKPDKAMSGVFEDQPDLVTLQALSQAFSSRAVS